MRVTAREINVGDDNRGGLTGKALLLAAAFAVLGIIVISADPQKQSMLNSNVYYLVSKKYLLIKRAPLL